MLASAALPVNGADAEGQKRNPWVPCAPASNLENLYECSVGQSDGKLYLSPVVDLFNREIVAYVEPQGNSDMVEKMLHKACRQRNDAALRPSCTISYAGYGTYFPTISWFKACSAGGDRERRSLN